MRFSPLPKARWPTAPSTPIAANATRSPDVGTTGAITITGETRVATIKDCVARMTVTGSLAAGVAAAVAAYDRGATILRVHDVREHVEALAVAAAVGA